MDNFSICFYALQYHLLSAPLDMTGYMPRCKVADIPFHIQTVMVIYNIINFCNTHVLNVLIIEIR